MPEKSSLNMQEIMGKIMRGQPILKEDMTQEEFSEFVKNIVMMDKLTGVSNASGAYSFCGEKQARGCLHDYNVYFINIKSMRILNERWGQKGGNQILRQYAQLLLKLTRPDGFVVRSGGDNFFAFVNRQNRDYFIENAHRLDVQIEVDGETWTERVEARMGEYAIQPGESGSYAMDASSMALQFIRTSSDQFLSVYSPDMKEQDFRSKMLKDSFEDALEAEEFIPYYQPKVNIQTGEIYGAEVLTRWKHDGELISPGVFIPILEHTGALCRLDMYMLDHMCRDIREWMDQGLKPVKISCNFSKKHLRWDDFADRVVQTIEKHGVDPKYVEIELTESHASENSEALESFMRCMKEHKISTSIDDFGNGHSSLSLLKSMKADTVKIDKSLIDDVGQGDRESDAIAGNVVRMLFDLEKEVVVEGVEEECQIDFLKRLNCNIVQGFYYAKPMPREQFEKWLKR